MKRLRGHFWRQWCCVWRAFIKSLTPFASGREPLSDEAAAKQTLALETDLSVRDVILPQRYLRDPLKPRVWLFYLAR